MTAVRALAFGDLEASAWGMAWNPVGATPILALGAGPGAEARPATLVPDAGTGSWRIEADGAQLVLTPLGEHGSTDQPDELRTESDQLCQVTGQLRVNSTE